MSAFFSPQNFMSLLNHKLIARCSKCDTNSFVRCHVGRDHDVQNLIFHTLRAIGNEMECENFQFDRLSRWRFNLISRTTQKWNFAFTDLCIEAEEEATATKLHFERSNFRITFVER